MNALTLAPMRRRPSRRDQRGIVVFVALIAVVLLSLAAVALMRSVHTSTLVVGNLAFRQAAMSMSTAAVETAVYDMFPPSATIADLRNDDLNRNYYASLQAGEDALGVPAVLQSVGAYPGTFKQLTDSAQSGNTARYVIERMCLPASVGKNASGTECEMIPPKQALGQTANEQYGIPFPRVPYYRLTVRVDGPNNSVTFSQAMLR
jgi:type IV pilus assembly protein PilX